ncbi:MAG: GNAT family N-acetyltransferase [Actinobacteria bacterium]|nr:GNAT family N-acetyltransferase [Actinomycetota bacterium]
MSRAPASAPAFRELDWPIRTERLLIRPAEPGDGPALWQHRGLPEVGKWLGWHPVDRADWDTTYASKYLDYLVVEHEGRLIGDLMLRQGDAWGQREVKDRTVGVQAELGWTFAPDAGGRGLATEAVAALIGVCFDDLGLRRIEAGAFAENEPSWRLMERVGMRRESYSVKESLHRELGWIDGVLYALLAEEWRAR